MGLVQTEGIYVHLYLFIHSFINISCLKITHLPVGQLGANAILAVSLAVCKAGASVKKIPLYMVCNIEV